MLLLKNDDKSFSTTDLLNNLNQPKLEHYKIEKEIGSGSFSKVYVGIHLLTNEKVIHF